MAGDSSATRGDAVPPLPLRRPSSWAASIEPTPAPDLIDSAGRLNVDGQDLKVIGTFLGELATATRSIRREVAAADEAATWGRERYRSLGSDDIKYVREMRIGFTTATEKLDMNLDNLANSIARTAAAMERIAKLYRDADERNKLDAATVRRYLG